MRRLVFPVALWSVAGFLAGLGTARVDALVALGAEKLTLPLLSAALLLAPGFVWHLLVHALKRFVSPRLAPLHLLLPAVALVYAGATLFSAKHDERPEVVAAAPGAEDVVLVTLDTFRADHVGAIGGRAETPVLDAFAAEGSLFLQAVTTAPLTAPAHASMLTGLEVRDHGLLRNGGTVRAPTVVGQLRRAGYHTGAFLSAAVLERKTGLAADFHHYDDRLSTWQRLRRSPWLDAVLDRVEIRQRPGERTLERALAWWEATPAPRFLWLHLYDAHAPYSPPESFAPSAEERRAARDLDKASRKQRSEEAPPTGGRRPKLPAGDASHRANENKLLYEAEVRLVDHLVGKLLEAVPKSATVIVVADHGESLDEHDYFFNHGATLWEESLRVPLMARGPSYPAGTRVSALVGVDAVAQSLLAGAGLAPASEGLAGIAGGTRQVPALLAYTTGQQARGERPDIRSFLGRLRGGEREQARSNISRGEKKKQMAALRFDQKKLIGSSDADPSFFDLSVDPAEASPQPVPEALAAEATRLKEVLSRPIDRPSDDELDRLRALGYVE